MANKRIRRVPKQKTKQQKKKTNDQIQMYLKRPATDVKDIVARDSKILFVLRST